ncbi:MAG: Multidomain signal transduction protein including CheB-like methylesterase, CheR-like methyltransferase and BaeS-like histidine kinase [uncultured Gemmatimonadetes bacterium]|uniref:histidine kinase n=1 Tax=uncultured Gemmatimonadota bacterium TaxID=203437 RepID=A0A6J4LMZ7_9BACT|nr:MAG: Multidomain signal transduction protein including CheB-like methylesterase, CheR-like methyltransferase and BaeS-like histidine kinase [uncultured Gemmatimonadota bacterium]
MSNGTPETDETLRLLADAIPQIVWLADREGRTEFFNRQWTAYTGEPFSPTTAAEVAARHLHADDVAPTMAAWEEARRGGRRFEVEHRIRSAEGEYRWFLVRAEPRHDPHTGRVERWFGTSTDIHEQKRAEQALQASEAKYRTLFTSLDDGFCILHLLFDEAGRPADYRFLEVNPRFSEQTGLRDALGRTAREMVPGLESFWFEVYGNVARTGEPSRFVNYSEPMGRWFDVYAFRVGEPHEHQVAVLFTDITRSKHAELERERLLRALEVERERLKHIFQQAPAFLSVVRGPDHVMELVNDAYYRMVGDRDVLGRPLRESLPELVEQGFIELLDRVLETGEPFIGRELPARLARTPGAPLEERFVDFVYNPITEADGTRSGIIAHGSDVTESVLARREVERLLRESEEARSHAEAARAEAEAANSAKADFLASMSHELRTPLNAIGGYVELLELGIHGDLTPAQQEALGRVAVNQRHLLTLINDVLAFARLEAGHVELDLRPLSARALLADVEPLVAPLAGARGVALSARDCDPALQLLGDEERVRQILLNLLGNGIKFTPPGGWVMRDCEADERWARLRVWDSGCGIAPEDHERIFDPFQQVGRRLNHPREGVGLGLAISRDLARAMGGDLTVASAPGAGSIFTLHLPRV